MVRDAFRRAGEQSAIPRREFLATLGKMSCLIALAPAWPVSAAEFLAPMGRGSALTAAPVTAYGGEWVTMVGVGPLAQSAVAKVAKGVGGGAATAIIDRNDVWGLPLPESTCLVVLVVDASEFVDHSCLSSLTQRFRDKGLPVSLYWVGGNSLYGREGGAPTLDTLQAAFLPAVHIPETFYALPSNTAKVDDCSPGEIVGDILHSLYAPFLEFSFIGVDYCDYKAIFSRKGVVKLAHSSSSCKELGRTGFEQCRLQLQQQGVQFDRLLSAWAVVTLTNSGSMRDYDEVSEALYLMLPELTDVIIGLRIKEGSTGYGSISVVAIEGQNQT